MHKLLIINPAKNYGSTGKIVEQIGLLANSKSWETSLVHSARYNRPSQLKCIKAGNKFSENLHALMALLFDRQGLESRCTTRNVIKQIKKYNPDIVHIHNLHGYFLNYPLIFKYLKESNVPVVWTMHDCWSFTGHCTYFDMVGCDKWKNECHHCTNLANYPKSLFFDRSVKNFKLKKQLFTKLNNIIMVPVSEWLAEMTRQSYMSKFKIHVINNGIDLNIFRVKESLLRTDLHLEDKFIVLGVSSNGFTGRKGFDDFIKLASLLPADYQIIMIGLHANELKLLPSNILAKMHTSNVNELVDYYNLADVFINPTYSDNFPTTNIESLACGTPVITYQTGGSPEAVDEKTGVVVKKGDIQSLANAIMKMKEHPLSSIDCRDRAVNKYNKNKRFEEYIELYNSLLEHNNMK